MFSAILRTLSYCIKKIDFLRNVCGCTIFPIEKISCIYTTGNINTIYVGAGSSVKPDIYINT